MLISLISLCAFISCCYRNYWPKMGTIGTSIGTGFQVSTCLNIALNREGLTRDHSYPESLHQCADGEGAQCNQALLGPKWATRSLAGCWRFFLKIYFQADPPIDRETKALAMLGLWPALLPWSLSVLSNIIATEQQLLCKANLSLARSSLNVCTQLPSLPRSSWNWNRGDSLHFLLNWRRYYCMVLHSWCSLLQWWLHFKAGVKWSMFMWSFYFTEIIQIN